MCFELDEPVGSEAIRLTLKNELRSDMNDYWCILPKENDEFVAAMEDIIDIYEKPYNPSLTVISKAIGFAGFCRYTQN